MLRIVFVCTYIAIIFGIVQNTVHGQQPPRIDLYALQQYREYNFTNGVLSSVACPTGCEEIGDCIARGPFWFVEGECMRIGYNGSIKYSTLSDKICEESFSDQNCNTKIGDDPFACTKEYPISQCNDISEKLTLYENYCIRADAPTYPYTTQMIKGFSATTLDECESEQNVHDALLPGSDGICRPLPYSMKDGSFNAGGSGYSFCEGETMIRDVFSDATCSSQDPNLHTYPNVGTTCDGSDDRGYLKTTDCRSPRIFCRDLSVTQFAFAVQVRDDIIARNIPTAGATNTMSNHWISIVFTTTVLITIGLFWSAL